MSNEVDQKKGEDEQCPLMLCDNNFFICCNSKESVSNDQVLSALFTKKKKNDQVLLIYDTIRALYLN